MNTHKTMVWLLPGLLCSSLVGAGGPGPVSPIGGIRYSADTLISNGDLIPASGWATEIPPGAPSRTIVLFNEYLTGNMDALDRWWLVAKSGHGLPLEYFSFDRAGTIGGLDYGPADVVVFDGATYRLAFDAKAVGLPPGANVDAVAVLDNGEMLLSFDASFDLGGGNFFLPSDVALWNGLNLSLAFDSTGDSPFLPSFAIPAGLNIDGLDMNETTGRFYFTFDSDGVLEGHLFRDHWVLSFDPNGAHQWRVLFYPGVGIGGVWATAGIDAFSTEPKPDSMFKDGFE